MLDFKWLWGLWVLLLEPRVRCGLWEKSSVWLSWRSRFLLFLQHAPAGVQGEGDVKEEELGGLCAIG